MWIQNFRPCSNPNACTMSSISSQSYSRSEEWTRGATGGTMWRSCQVGFGSSHGWPESQRPAPRKAGLAKKTQETSMLAIGWSILGITPWKIAIVFWIRFERDPKGHQVWETRPYRRVSTVGGGWHVRSITLLAVFGTFFQFDGLKIACLGLRWRTKLHANFRGKNKGNRAAQMFFNWGIFILNFVQNGCFFNVPLLTSYSFIFFRRRWQTAFVMKEGTRSRRLPENSLSRVY